MKETRARIWLEAVLLVVLYLVATWWVARTELVEAVLAGGGGQWWRLSLAVAFVLLRLFVVLLAPGFFLARWLVAGAAPPVRGRPR
jgi:hypothetical protein